ncbi:MAG: hypothetical protein IPP78_11295 [Holophagaceae bacterium]|nr:hypothetical protein [Holophagaceae bacterium]
MLRISSFQKLPALISPARMMAPLLLPALLFGGDTISVSGRGEFAVEKKWKTSEANQLALQRAEALAVEDAIAQAVYQIYGNRSKLGADADRIIKDVVAHKANMVVDTQVTGTNVDAGKAMVELVLKIDGKAMKRYLEDSLGLSLSQETEGKFKVIVLSYTIEGQDADKSKPLVLREEVTDDRKNVQAASFAASSSHASASSSQSSLQAASASSSKGSAAFQSQGSMQASRDRQSAAAVQGDRGSAAASSSSSAQMSAQRSSSGAAAWDNQRASSIDARSSRASASSSKSSASGAAFSDTSSFYHRITVYADPTKKGAGATNEVRAALGEMIEKSGLNTKFLDMDLMGRNFETEDDLYSVILSGLKRNPDVGQGDYVAVALNRFTPVNSNHRYTSQVVYRVIRIKDGDTLLPDKVIIGDSGDQASDDVGRATATKLAMRKADSVLPDELRAAVKKTQRAEKRENASASTTYVIRVDNIASPASTAAIKQALRGAGMTVSPQFRGDARSETITVAMNGKTGSDVLALLETLIDKFAVVTMDERNTILKGK